MNRPIALALSVTSIACAGCHAGHHLARVENAETPVEAFLRWLPADMETVMADNVPRAGSKWFGGPLLFLPEDLFSANPRLQYDYAFLSFKNPQLPKAVGIGHIDLVWVAKFRAQSSKALDKWLKAKAKSEKRSGDTFYTLRAEKPATEWTYTFFESGGLVFCSSSDALLAEVLKRRESDAARVAFPTTLDQWKYVDTKADFWAIRQWAERSHHLPWGLNMNDPQLVGYAVQADRLTNKLRVVSISKNPDGLKIARELWAYEGPNHKSK